MQQQVVVEDIDAKAADAGAEDALPPLQILQPSPWWWSMRRGGCKAFIILLQTTLRALAAAHAANVTHRHAMGVMSSAVQRSICHTQHHPQGRQA